MTKQQIKSSARRGLAWIYRASRHSLKHLKGKALILAYHRVLSEKELAGDYFIQPGMYVRNDVFEQQMRYLTEHFQVVSLMELLNHWAHGTWDHDKRYCVITFDDGWRDNYIYAYPILRKYNIPATIFLPTDFIGTKQWFWPDKMGYLLMHSCGNGSGPRAANTAEGLLDRYPWGRSVIEQARSGKIDSAIEMCKEFPEETIYAFIDEMSRTMEVEFPDEHLLLNWQEAREMSQQGISFASHSCTHKILSKLSPEEIRNEMERSFRTLGENEINYIPVFAYPNGTYNEEIIKHAKAAGYRAAVSMAFGFEGGSPKCLFQLRRVGIHNDISATIPLFVFHVSGLRQSLISALSIVLHGSR
jgi:peptidoglycan/xylan/chitin deacetylase (PgdA/CDA1 family)